MIVSASALVRHCGYARRLRRERKPSPDQQRAMERGTVFHAAVEHWVVHRELPQVDDLEMQGWLDLLASNWTPPLDAEVEMAWGLSPDGKFVPVKEPEPHVYVAVGGAPLLTAGRCDVAWGGNVLDWKTGKWPATSADRNLQVNAAGIALADRYGWGSYTPSLYYARDGYLDEGPRVVMDSPEYEQILTEIREAALLDETPRPGQWCAGCWERRACSRALLIL